MEAARRTLEPSARSRACRLEQSCERLRPLGEAYVMRRFGGQLNRADAEDAVAEVLIRFHRRIAEGRLPENLRAAFFTSVRNAAVDVLRSRAARPTVGLEAAMTTPAEGAAPPEWAESREDTARLQDALARLRGRYREAILLRFGLGLTVPEIATHFEISLPAAKKLMLRATRHVKERLAAIEEAEFCPQMREMARRSLFEKEASGLASESEAEVLRAHFAHCGSCRSFLASMHERLHDLGSAALLGLAAGEQRGARLGLIEHVGEWLGAGAQGVQVAAEKVRQLALRIGGAASPADSGAAGALLGSGQKIAAICTAGAATTATCLLGGAVGPGIGASAPILHPHHSPHAKVRRLAAEAPQPSLPAPSPPADQAETLQEANRPAVQDSHAPPPQSPPPPPTEFGVESGSSSGAVAGSSSPPTSSGGEFGAPSGGASRSGAGSGGSVGFQG